MPDKTASQAAIEALQGMTPAQRAAQLFGATIGSGVNSFSGGIFGRALDVLRGVPQGSTGEGLTAQVHAASPVIDTTSRVLGLVGGGLALKAAFPAVAGVTRAALTAAPAIGARAAALGATSPTYAGQIARFVAPAAGALGVGALLNNGESPAAAAPIVAVPTTGPHAGQTGGLQLTGGGPVADALAQGRAAPADPQRDLATSISAILGHNPSIADVAAVGGLVPASVRPAQAQRDMVFGQAYGMSKAIADQQVAALQAQVAAGTITEDKARTTISDVLQRHFDQTAGLVGFNPANMANAAILNGTTAGVN